MNRGLQTDWFEDARFGMFIHFGLYSIPAGVWNGQRMGRNDYAEWIRMQHNWPTPGGIPRAEYDTLLAPFNPVGFDANAWMREARNAGMRYFIITAWMTANGEAVHGTRPAPYPEPAWGRLTWNTTSNRLYALVYDPKPGTTIAFVGPATPPAHAWVLETGETLSVTPARADGFDLTLPGYLPDDNILAIGME